MMADTSPFITHELDLFGSSQPAHALRSAVLSLSSVNYWSMTLKDAGSFDEQHYKIFIKMVQWNRIHGETEEFLRICERIKQIESNDRE